MLALSLSFNRHSSLSGYRDMHGCSLEMDMLLVDMSKVLIRSSLDVENSNCQRAYGSADQMMNLSTSALSFWNAF